MRIHWTFSANLITITLPAGLRVPLPNRPQKVQLQHLPNQWQLAQVLQQWLHQTQVLLWMERRRIRQIQRLQHRQQPRLNRPKNPKKAIAGISAGATISGILMLVALARRYRIWSNGIFHNIFRRGQQSAAPQNHKAELQGDHPTELPVNQEIKGSRVWVHPRGSRGLYEVPKGRTCITYCISSKR